MQYMYILHLTHWNARWTSFKFNRRVFVAFVRAFAWFSRFYAFSVYNRFFPPLPPFSLALQFSCVVAVAAVVLESKWKWSNINQLQYFISYVFFQLCFFLCHGTGTQAHTHYSGHGAQCAANSFSASSHASCASACVCNTCEIVWMCCCAHKFQLMLHIYTLLSQFFPRCNSNNNNTASPTNFI